MGHQSVLGLVLPFLRDVQVDVEAGEIGIAGSDRMCLLSEQTVQLANSREKVVLQAKFFIAATAFNGMAIRLRLGTRCSRVCWHLIASPPGLIASNEQPRVTEHTSIEGISPSLSFRVRRIPERVPPRTTGQSTRAVTLQMPDRFSFFNWIARVG